MAENGEDKDDTDYIEGTIGKSATGKPDVALAMHAVNGFSEMGTSKIRGYIGAETVTVLINYGTAHHFFARDLYVVLGLPLSTTDASNLELNNGIVVGSRRLCWQINLGLLATQVVEDFSVLSFDGAHHPPRDEGAADSGLDGDWQEAL